LSVGQLVWVCLVRAARLREFGDLTRFGALRAYETRPRFWKELKEWSPAADRC
jgi:hypothetical protein